MPRDRESLPKLKLYLTCTSSKAIGQGGKERSDSDRAEMERTEIKIGKPKKAAGKLVSRLHSLSRLMYPCECLAAENGSIAVSHSFWTYKAT